MSREWSAPEWSLTGIEIQWPDGQHATLSQSRWRRDDNATGWTCQVSVPRNVNGNVRFAFVTLQFSDRMRALLDKEGAWVQAKNLIVQRMRARGSAETELGEIHLG